MIVEVDPSSPTPPYEQIRAQVAMMITTGALPSGTQLPPIRQLAADLGLAANTVARAYRELELEGLVQSRVRHGTTVAATAQPMPPAEVRRRLDEAAATYAATVRRLGLDGDSALSAAERALTATTPADSPKPGDHGS